MDRSGDKDCRECSMTVFCDRTDSAARTIRADLSDEEWEIVAPLLPSERGRWARPAFDNRIFFNGILHVLGEGCPWRDMDERYGRWNSVYVRFQRWTAQGVWDRVLPTMVALGLTDHWPETTDEGRIRKLVIETAARLRLAQASQDDAGGVARQAGVPEGAGRV
ncbi:MAG: transposase [Alphaproteobacteria bacterium]|nr:transposase [Alphaproteobacteria bacterium]